MNRVLFGTNVWYTFARRSVLVGCTLCLLAAGCRPSGDDAGATGSRAKLDPTREPGYFVNDKHGYSVRFVDDWIIQADDRDHVTACASTDERVCIELLTLAAPDSDAAALFELLETQLSARHQAWRELVREPRPSDGDTPPFLLYEFDIDDSRRRAIVYLRNDARPIICVTGSAPAERFAEHAGGFRLTAAALKRTR